MPKVQNHTNGEIILPSGPRIPPRGTIAVTDAQIEHPDSQAFLAAMINSGKVTVGLASRPIREPEPETLTRGVLAKMRKEQLQNLAGEQGVKYEGTVDQMRVKLADLIFGDE